MISARTAPRFAFRRHARELALATLCLAEADTAVVDSLLDDYRRSTDDETFTPAHTEIATHFQTALGAFHDAEIRPEIYDSAEPTKEELDRDELFVAFARELAEGAWGDRESLDQTIAPKLHRYSLDRLARVDRNALRLGLWELENLAYMPPAVTVNEWVDVARRYSSVETGRFVNGVLRALASESSKADFDAGAAPPDPQLGMIESPRARLAEVEIEEVPAESEEAAQARKFGFVLRSGDRDIPPLESDDASS